ncbi:hypothetical protein H6B10_17980, partial [Gemmiger formicilis]|uniref:hypothetical protein n=1 Tax=Gemmiger formicilis TaxID=745368 RepID=UPI00195C4D94
PFLKTDKLNVTVSFSGDGALQCKSACCVGISQHLGSPDRTMELMIEALRILRQEYHFNGYIHAKTIPGADP